MPNESRFDRLFDAALSLQGDARADFLRSQPDDVREQLQVMLQAHEQADAKGFLRESGEEWGSSNSSETDGLPTTIGPYKILQPIGLGGMGQVFMAEQTEPVKRRVALKVIRTETPTKEILARFEAERQALAMMDHQNIAKVLDAGVTEDGRPFFAMELVKGIPITEYCDKNKLTPNERLDLFVQTCRAIQHAHQKGIVHRDIKPSNVLVTLYDGKPVAKVIDFGLAKALQDITQLTNRTLFTQYGQVIGTLAYMSPEQAEMNALDVDTRTDVYSLGVILYELLTGSTPLSGDKIKNEAFDRVLALIREEEATRPSQRLSESGDAITGISEQRQTEPKRLRIIMKGDLDWIAVKALEKDRTRRYDGPAALADDVERYLNSEAITARPPSLTYQLQKAFRRHRTSFLMTGTICTLLIVGLLTTFILWRKATAATSLAAKEAKSARDAQRAESTAKRALELRATSALLNGRAVLAAERTFNAASVVQSEAFSERLMRGRLQNFDSEWKAANSSLVVTRLSGDQQMLVAIGARGEVGLWDIRQQPLRIDLQPPPSDITDVRFSADDSNLVVCNQDAEVIVYTIATGTESSRHSFAPFKHSAIALTAFGEQLLRITRSSADKTETSLVIHRVTDGKEINRLEHWWRMDSLTSLDDGNRIAVCGMSNKTRVYDANTGDWLAHDYGPSKSSWLVSDNTLLRITDKAISLVAIPADRELWHQPLAGLARPYVVSTVEGMVAVATADNHVQIWDTSQGKMRSEISIGQSKITSLALSNDTRTLFVGSEDGCVRSYTSSQDSRPHRLAGRQDVRGPVKVSGDGKLVACVNADNTLLVLSSETWAPIPGLTHSDGQSKIRHRSPIHTVSFSANTELVATCDDLGLCCVWDLSNGTIQKRVDFSANVKSVVFSPTDDAVCWVTADGKVAFATIDKMESPFRAATSTPLHSLSFSPDGGELLTTGADGSIRVWNVETRKEVRQINPIQPAVTTDAIRANTTQSVVADSSDRIHVVDDSGEIWTLKTVGIQGLCVSDDGKKLLTTDGRKLERWSLQLRRKDFEIVNSWARHVAFQPESHDFVVTTSHGDFEVWQTENSDLRISRPLAGPVHRVNDIAVSADGHSLLASTGPSPVQQPKARVHWLGQPERFDELLFHLLANVWLKAEGKTSTSPNGPDAFLAKTLARGINTGQIRIFDLKTATERPGLDGPLFGCGPIVDTGETILVGGNDGGLHTSGGNEPVYLSEAAKQQVDTALNGRITQLLNNMNLIGLEKFRNAVDWENLRLDYKVRSIVRSSEPDRLLSLSNSPDGVGAVHVLDPNGKVLEKIPVRNAVAGSFVPGTPGGLMAIATTGGVVFWNHSTQQQSREKIECKEINCLAVSHDGQRLAIGLNDGSIQIRGIKDPALVTRLRGHTAAVNTIQFLPTDGDTLVSGGTDGVVKVWSVGLSAELLSLEEHSGPIRKVLFGKNEQTLITAADGPEGMGEIIVWQTPREGQNR